MELGNLADDEFRGVFRLKYAGDAHLVLQTKVQANPLLNRPISDLPFSPVQMVAADASLTVPMFLRLSDMRLNGVVILLFTKNKGLSMVFRNDPLDNVLVTSTFDSIPAIRNFLQCQIEKKLRQLLCDELPAIIQTLSLAWTGAKKSPKVRPTHLDFSVPSMEVKSLGGTGSNMPKSIPLLYRNQSFTGRGQLTPFTPAIAQAIYKSTSLSALDLAERKATAQGSSASRVSPRKARKKHSVISLRKAEPTDVANTPGSDISSSSSSSSNYFSRHAPKSVSVKDNKGHSLLPDIAERSEKSLRPLQLSDQQKIRLMQEVLSQRAADDSRYYMSLAIDEARKSEYIPSAFCVGCVIVKNGNIISTGYSREIPGNTHAEQCALEKLANLKEAEGADMYTTMEPCSERLSGNVPCVQRIIKAKIARVFQGVHEPTDFIACVGSDMLKQSGITVKTVEGFEDLAIKIARGEPCKQSQKQSFKEGEISRLSI